MSFHVYTSLSAAILLVTTAVVLWYIFEEEQKKISMIRPGIYISSWSVSRDEHLLKKKRIKRIICLGTKRKTDQDLQMYARLGIDHYYFHIDDIPSAPIGLLFDQTNKLIDEIGSGEKGSVLVHCHAGVSRSATIVAANLIHKGMDDVSAISFIRAARPIVWPNAGFRRVLRYYSLLFAHRSLTY